MQCRTLHILSPLELPPELTLALASASAPVVELPQPVAHLSMSVLQSTKVVRK